MNTSPAGLLWFPAPVGVRFKGLELYSILESKSPRKLLRLFMGKGRVRRGEEIEDREVSIKEASGDMVNTRVRDYNVVIDVENRELLHDCADYSRAAPLHQFCKHIGKIFLTISRDIAVKLLEEIYKEKDSWSFRPVEEGGEGEGL